MSQADRLAALDWDALVPRLRLFARKLHGHHRMAARPGLPSPDDLVHDAVEAAYAGRRTWPAEVSAFGFLCGAIRSIAFNTLQRHHAVPLGDASDPPAPTLGEPPALLHDLIHACFDDHPELQRLANLYIEDVTAKASDLAERMQMPVKRMYRLLRAMRRRLGDCLSPDGSDPAPRAVAA
ncbi:MAG: hypothetical protein AAGF99_11060 [Bacteroidota bacterium]